MLVSSLLPLVGCKSGEQRAMDLQNIAHGTEGARNAAKAIHPEGWRWVTNMDESGRVYSEGWEYDSPAVPFDNGLLQVRRFVQRLLKSPKHTANLAMLTLDDACGVHILRLDRKIIFFTNFALGQADDQGADVRIQPSHRQRLSGRRSESAYRLEAARR